MDKAFGIVNPSGNHIWVDGLQEHRPIAAFSFLGRYRVIDFPISNMSNSGIDQIQVYVRKKPRSLTEHIGTGRHYNINSKRGNIQLLFTENRSENDIYNTDIAGFLENIDNIADMTQPYVVIAPSYMVYSMDFSQLLSTHIDSNADITLLYHTVDNADQSFINCDFLNLNRQNGVLSIEKNRGNAANRDIFMDTYIMKKDLLLDLIQKAKRLSSIYTLAHIVNISAKELDIRGVQHTGYFASITDFKSYYNSNLALLNFEESKTLFQDDWPIYTRTNDSCPTQYFEEADVKNSLVSNGCLIEGTIENSVIGRGCIIKKGAVVKNSILSPKVVVEEGIRIENQVVDKLAHLIHATEVIATVENPGYIRRRDTI